MESSPSYPVFLWTFLRLIVEEFEAFHVTTWKVLAPLEEVGPLGYLLLPACATHGLVSSQPCVIATHFGSASAWSCLLSPLLEKLLVPPML
ncbi:hypothetical protein LIER_32757 [Lithospermum erythrorhizon]|uniref:Uncharacterized protein n=1 Tax=Lithospermum erythrorhizon TaxID=34254 RepID=A0AAV3RVN7_LITER